MIDKKSKLASNNNKNVYYDMDDKDNLFSGGSRQVDTKSSVLSNLKLNDLTVKILSMLGNQHESDNQDKMSSMSVEAHVINQSPVHDNNNNNKKLTNDNNSFIENIKSKQILKNVYKGLPISASLYLNRKEKPSKVVNLIDSVSYLNNLNRNNHHENGIYDKQMYDVDYIGDFMDENLSHISSSSSSSSRLPVISMSSHSFSYIIASSTTAAATTTSPVPSTSTTGTTTASSTIYSYSSSLNELNYKNNELYSIFVSMFTAAIFLFFIMWRWFRMKSDLRKALREQLEIQQQEQLNNSSSSSSATNTTRHTPSTPISSSSTTLSPTRLSTAQSSSYYHQHHHHHPLLIHGNREQLQATAASLLSQLSNGEHRSPRQHQQIIDTAKYCLQQLRIQSRINNRQYNNSNGASLLNGENEFLNNYYSYNSRYCRAGPMPQLSTTVELSCSRYPSRVSASSLSQTPFNNHDYLSSPLPESSSSASSFDTDNSYQNINSSVYNFFNNGSGISYQQRTTINELPPPYESLISKSSSLPSYCNLKKTEEKNEYE